ncbi:Ycf51 family protein [Pseudanabaena sp. FACHB-1998]|uniref:Ycf51 family protein n=1 Tax=Pseudanabaena sp. FACHB-1998 TaxID=2692858 RepID=UPI001681B7FE|nr:Ycf51 family protein [Pseudanabaena sp. FACHB-1998]MBD2176316.1 Ycf51 family protein [Pseudanabaena sp. FACHB-1998]
MSLTPALFGQLAQGMGIFVLACALVTGLAVARQWSWRYRMVGATLFSVVLVVGLFSLSFEPITRTSIEGSVAFKTVFDRFGPQATIVVPPTVTPEQLVSTLKQASSNLFSPGRNSQGAEQLTIYARTVIHPQEGVSKPLYLGRVKRSLSLRNDPNIEIEIFPDKFAELPKNQSL